MADLTPDELLALARIARLNVIDEDVEPLTMQFNAVLEALDVLDEHPLDGVTPLPSLPFPGTLPSHEREGRSAPALPSESEAPLAYKPITELAQLIATRQVSPSELTELYLDRIGQHDGALVSYITVTSEVARKEAAEAERRLADGAARGPLDGIPLAYKDEFLTRGVLTTCGSALLSEYVPDYDATAVALLHDAGAIMLGKLNMTEMATPLTLEFAYGQPRNPWNLDYDPGGSSSGSGSATAAALCAGALGEDTGGSIRRPASNNSCVGLRPSLGRVSVHGLIPSTYYQDTAGPLTRSVADCALLMNAIAGYDPSDPLSAQLPVPDYTAVLDGDVKGLRVGVIHEARDAAHLHPEIKAQLDDAVQRFARMGAAVEDVSLPLIGLSSTFSGALGSPRVALQWTFLRDRPRDYDTAARLFSLLPALMPASLLQRAMQLRSLIRDQMLAAFERYDVLLLPSYSSPSARIEDTKVPAGSKEQIVAGLRRFNFATPANIAGIPAISVPAGFTSDGLPFGLQIMGGRFDEESVFRAAFAYEQDTPWHTMRPSFGDE